MSQTLTAPPVESAPTQLTTSDDFPRKRWTVKECRFLQEAGLLTPGKFELIEGDIVVKMPQGFVHLFVIQRLLEVLAGVFGFNRLLSQGPVGIGRSDSAETAPEPDVYVLRDAASTYVARGGPRPETDVLLIVEVSVSTLAGDKKVKNRIYARAGISEYWVVNVEGRELIVHRQPGADGYASVVTLQETDTVSPLAAPASTINGRDLLP